MFPSTLIAWPVRLRAAGDERKSAMAATSSSVTMRRSEIFCRYCARIASTDTPAVAARAPITLFMRSPSTVPGRIALTRTPCGPSSIASDFMRPTMAHLVAA